VTVPCVNTRLGGLVAQLLGYWICDQKVMSLTSGWFAIK